MLIYKGFGNKIYDRVSKVDERVDALRNMRLTSEPYKKKMELLTLLLNRSLKQKQGDCLTKLINLNKDKKRMNMQLRLSNLYWNLRRNHLKKLAS